MALFQLLRAVGRHLAIAAAGLALTMSALLAIEATHAGVHQVRGGVVIAPPDATITPNPFWGREYSVITTAGLVTRMVTDGSVGARTSSSSVSLAGQGLTDGWSVALVNSGSQWVVDYDRPIIDVQAVGPTAERAAANFDEAVGELDAALTRLQDDSDVAPDRRVRLQLIPEAPAVTYGEGRPTRARAATVALGGALTLAAVVVAEQRRTRRRARQALLAPPDPKRPEVVGAAPPGH